MNQTFNKRPYNPVSFDLFLNSGKESRQKKSNNIYNNNSKVIYKQAIISGPNYPRQNHTIFNNYSQLSSLTKCNSTTKLIKTHSNCNISSSAKSFICYASPDVQQEQQQHHHQIQQNHMHGSPSPSPSFHQNNLSKNHNEKSISTTQSTEERKELNKLKMELKEKNDIIKALNRTIDNYKYEKKNSSTDLMTSKMQLAELKLENTRIKQDNRTLTLALDKVKNENNKLQSKEFKLNEIKSILTKEEMSMYKEEEEEDDTNRKGDEPSLIGICFTDKIKMDKKIDSNNARLPPALDFRMIYNELQSPGNLIQKNKSMSEIVDNNNDDEGQLQHHQKRLVKNSSFLASRYSNNGLLNNNLNHNNDNNNNNNAQCRSYHQNSSQHHSTNSLIPINHRHGQAQNQNQSQGHHNCNSTSYKSKIVFGRKSMNNTNKTEGVGLYMNNSLGNIRK